AHDAAGSSSCWEERAVSHGCRRSDGVHQQEPAGGGSHGGSARGRHAGDRWIGMDVPPPGRAKGRSRGRLRPLA
ncbi:unnamed protein product, partial [Ectocarpus sp. 12 AP-2014]